MGVLEAPPAPQLYESRRGDHRLIIDPQSGSWWIGEERHARQGREKVRERGHARGPRGEADSYDDFPSMLVVIKNKDCNLACTYCFAEANDDRAYPESGYLVALFGRLLRDFPRKKFVFLFSGGEPLLHFDAIKDTVEAFTAELNLETSRRVSFGLMTNGTPINQSVVDFVKAHGVQVCVSLDGPPEIHDRNRPTLSGRGSLGLLQGKLDLLRRNNVPFSTISTVVDPEDVIPTFDFLVNHGLKRCFLRPLRMQGRQVAEYRSHPASDHEDYELRMAAEFLRLADRIVERNRVADDAVVEGTLANHVTHLITRTNPFMCLRSPCGAGCGAKLGIDWNGNIYPCDTMVEFPGLMIAAPSEVLVAPDISTLLGESNVMQTLSGRRTDNITQCRTCHVQRFCGGGCSATSYEVNGDLRSPSDRCNYERALLEGLLWKIFDNPMRARLILGMKPRGNPQRQHLI